jgi:uncharacterized protein YjbJ (UPF0337 family)
MDWKTYLKGNWHQVKGKIKENWGSLTDDTLNEIEGREEALVGAIMKEYSITEEQARQDLNEFLEKSKM